MFLRKRITVSQFLERRVTELMTVDGIFTLEGFYDEYSRILSDTGVGPDTEEAEEGTHPSVDRDLFINRFIGTLLWLIKYRILSNLFNSPRKQAYLDLNFDIAIPEIVDRRFICYNTEIIKQTYDNMDIGCKKAYTGEMQREDKPRFLVSPLWTKDPSPHPFRVAARLFMEALAHGTVRGVPDHPDSETLIDVLEERFTSMTENAAQAARRVILT